MVLSLAHFLELCILLAIRQGHQLSLSEYIITITQRGIKMSFDYKRMIKFEHNIGANEKKYRLYGGAALLVISVFTASILLLAVGMVLVGTGFSGWCPLYSGLNRNNTVVLDTSTEE